MLLGKRKIAVYLLVREQENFVASSRRGCVISAFGWMKARGGEGAGYGRSDLSKRQSTWDLWAGYP